MRASRSQVVFSWMRHLLIFLFFRIVIRPRPFFILQDNQQGWLGGFRRRGLWMNLLIVGGYAVLIWAIVRAQIRLSD